MGFSCANGRDDDALIGNELQHCLLRVHEVFITKLRLTPVSHDHLVLRREDAGTNHANKTGQHIGPLLPLGEGIGVFIQETGLLHKHLHFVVFIGTTLFYTGKVLQMRRQ